jgi:hypothetical protein
MTADEAEVVSLDTLDLTPSPRILEMIAEVDLKTWQCLAELVDNSFDELRRASEERPERDYRVDVFLPSSGQAGKDSEITVTDTGRGMTIDQMRTALRAGSSGNQAHGNLGLFGMGFNVATARMGHITTVKTGRECDDHWTIATIDIRAMQREDTYRVPLTRESKDVSEHGTIVTITGLRTDMIQRLKSTQEVSQVKKQLGRVYSYILRDASRNKYSGSDVVGGMGIPLYLNGNAVNPVLPCIWDPNRSVTRHGKEIAAVQVIDRPLTDAFACMNCGFWFTKEPSTCSECGGTDIQQRGRRIWGWLGIQRYNSKNDFGVNFIRLGRAIAVQDKGLFEWVDEFGSRDTEYPVEIAGGRIVGEIHLDHAPVNFRKTDFDRENRAWTSMFEAVHGVAPLKPNKAKELGTEREDTPLVLLFDGFRRDDPGLNYLVPGNGSTAIHERARLWGEDFHKSVPGFETDEKWYAAAKEHDDIVSGVQPHKPETSEADEDFFESEGLGDLLDDESSSGDSEDDAAPTPASVPTSKSEETTDARFVRYESNSTPLPELDGKLQVGPNTTLLRAFVTSSSLIAEGSPHYAVRVKGGETQVFVSEQCSLIRDFGWAPSDVALMFAARKLMAVYGVTDDPSEFTVGLIEQFDSRKLDSGTVRKRGEGVLESIREMGASVIEGDPERYWLGLNAQARRDAEDVAVRDNPDIAWDSAIEDGSFGRYLTPDGFVDLLRSYPEDFLDGAVFATKYVTWSDRIVREEQVDRLCGLLHDLRRMIAGVRANQPRELARYLISTDLLSAEVAT